MRCEGLIVEEKPTQEITKLQELTYELTVEQAMSPEVITVSSQDTMAQFREVLRVNCISGMPVVESGEMVGVVSIEDLIKRWCGDAAGDCHSRGLKRKNTRGGRSETRGNRRRCRAHGSDRSTAVGH
jgi:CBS-domain-containing membrane protein